MTELFSLIKNLNADELKEIKASFKKLVSIDTESFLLEKLFNHIVSEQEKIKSDKQLSLLLYQQEKLSAVSKLKSRLFYFVLEALSSDNLLRREDLFAPSDKQIIRIRKKMLHFRVIYRKKNRAEFSVLSHLLNEIIKEAKEYEQYDIIVEALVFKKYLLMLRKGFSEIEEIDERIVFYTDAHKLLVKANDYYFNLITDQEVISKLKPQEKQKMLKQTMNELKKYVQQTKSPSIAYLNKLVELDYLISLGKHKVTVDLCFDIISHLFKYPHLYKNERVGFAYDNISHCQIYNHDFKNAVINSKKAQTFYPPKGTSFLSSKQQEFYACFYSGAYKSANEIIKDLLNSPMINTGEYRYDKFLFLNACTLFKLGFYNDALAICNQTLLISKDKGRWAIGIRYLKCMCLIELKDNLDEAQKLIDAFRKVIDRNKEFISSRDELIYKMLNEYSRTGFNSVSNTKLETLCKKLAAKNDIDSWNYYTHELIPLHSWVEQRIGLLSKK